MDDVEEMIKFAKLNGYLDYELIVEVCKSRGLGEDQIEDAVQMIKDMQIEVVGERKP